MTAQWLLLQSLYKCFCPCWCRLCCKMVP